MKHNKIYFYDGMWSWSGCSYSYCWFGEKSWTRDWGEDCEVLSRNWIGNVFCSMC